MLSKAHATKGCCNRDWRWRHAGRLPSSTLVYLQWARLSPHAGRIMERIVAVVDDDKSIRESLPYLLREFGLAAKAFASAQEFLSYDYIADIRCLILDIVMPGISGPELQRELVRRGYLIPIIFITARSTESIPPDLLQHGAVKCLFKPFSGAELRAALDSALRNT